MSTTNGLGYLNQSVGLPAGDCDDYVIVPFDRADADAVIFENEYLRLKNKSGELRLLLKYSATPAAGAPTVFKHGTFFMYHKQVDKQTGLATQVTTSDYEYKTEIFNESVDGTALQYALTENKNECEFLLVEGNAGGEGPATLAEQALGARLAITVGETDPADQGYVRVTVRGTRLRRRNVF